MYKYIMKKRRYILGATFVFSLLLVGAGCGGNEVEEPGTPDVAVEEDAENKTTNPKPDGAYDGENLIVKLPAENWKVANSQRAGGVGIAEYIPENQELETWEDLLNVQIFYNKQVDPSVFMNQIELLAPEACNGVDQKRETYAVPDPAVYSSAGLLQYCLKNKATGQSEVTLYKTIAGKDSFYVVSRAWRGDALTQKDVDDGIIDDKIEEWREFLGGVTLCDTRGENPTCVEAFEKSTAVPDNF